MTVAELREQAKRLGLKGYSRMKKAELLALIDAADNTSLADATTDQLQVDVLSLSRDELMALTKKDLRKAAKSLYVARPSKMNKSQLVTAILARQIGFETS